MVVDDSTGRVPDDDARRSGGRRRGVIHRRTGARVRPRIRLRGRDIADIRGLRLKVVRRVRDFGLERGEGIVSAGEKRRHSANERDPPG